MNRPTPGPVVLFGSGETSPSGRRVFDHALAGIEARSSRLIPLEVVLLETPAGFELNSAQVIGRVEEFLQVHLQNYEFKTTVIPARKKGTPFSPDNDEITFPLLYADMVFMGPGSPTYAVRQLEDSLAWSRLVASHRLGATLVLASAATVAVSTYALPVYEIYKVGEELHWKDGLNLFAPYGLEIIFIPHWNNNDGGDELDTSRCFMGKSRFKTLIERLPEDIPIIGIDEKTALVIDTLSGQCNVLGLGGVEVILNPKDRSDEGKVYENRKSFDLSEIGEFRIPTDEELPPEVWQQAQEVRSQVIEEPDSALPSKVSELVDMREAARSQKDWESADNLRAEIRKLGWKVKDTPNGPVMEKARMCDQI
jgi:hypothetical protein